MVETQFRSSKSITRLVQASYNYNRFKSNDVTCTTCSPIAIPGPHWNNLQLPQQPTDLPPMLGAGGNNHQRFRDSSLRRPGLVFSKKTERKSANFSRQSCVNWNGVFFKARIVCVCTADGKNIVWVDRSSICMFPERKTCILGGAGFQPSKVHQCRDTEPGSLVPRHRPTWLTSQEASWPRLNSTSPKNEQGSFGDRVHGGEGFSTVWQNDVQKVYAWWLIKKLHDNASIMMVSHIFILHVFFRTVLGDVGKSLQLVPHFNTVSQFGETSFGQTIEYWSTIDFAD